MATHSSVLAWRIPGTHKRKASTSELKHPPRSCGVSSVVSALGSFSLAPGSTLAGLVMAEVCSKGPFPSRASFWWRIFWQRCSAQRKGDLEGSHPGLWPLGVVWELAQATGQVSLFESSPAFTPRGAFALISFGEAQAQKSTVFSYIWPLCHYGPCKRTERETQKGRKWGEG